jgi:HPr kinase/phosphorylase
VPGATETPLPFAERLPIARFQLHGSTIAIKVADRWHAALIRGVSGAGKSDLALRCLAQPLNPLFPEQVRRDGARLVSDDRTDIAVAAGTAGPLVTASSPATIAGLLEVRGLGLIAVPHVPSGRLILVIDLAAPSDVPRYPEPETASFGMTGAQGTPTDGSAVAILPRISLAPFEMASPLKLLLALARTALTGSPVGADAAKPHCLPEGQ